MKITTEMPAVTRCAATQCAYNVNKNCHARAITVGDATRPGCDTFFSAPQHNKEAKRIAGVGACKISQCKFNDDYECVAENITVGYSDDQVNCLAFKFMPRPDNPNRPS
jgi:hypothetical protein